MFTATRIGVGRGFSRLGLAWRLGHGWYGARTFLAVTALVPSLGSFAASPPIEFAYVAGDADTHGRPEYGFLVARTEVRNDQFVDFLNDALAHPDDARGEFMYFDGQSGDVLLDNGFGSPGLPGDETILFRVAANRNIVFNRLAGRYEFVLEFGDHPATGMSWLGALKFCNWLTLHVEQSAEQRVYVEGPAPLAELWRPVTISESAWLIRDLNSTERMALLDLHGFRLPMDGGETGTGGSPGPFNEWYKAAAWDPTVRTHWVYGFGRDVISGSDANFRCSGDSFEDGNDCITGGTTPVGYFDGTLRDGVFQTTASDNAYGIFDLSGNVWEWMQDRSFDLADRRNRGGSFRSAHASLAAALEAEREATSAHDATGFRIVLVQEVVGDLAVIPQVTFAVSGVWGGPFDDNRSSKTYRVHNVGIRPATFQTTTDAVWIRLVGMTSATLAPGTSSELGVEIDASCDDGLRVGENLASVTERHPLDGAEMRRIVRYTVREPLDVTPTDPMHLTMPFGGLPEQALPIFTLGNRSNRAVHWTASSTDVTDPTQPAEPAAWLLLNARPTAGGQVDAGQSAVLRVTFPPNAADPLPPGEYRAEVTVTNECTGTHFVRLVTLTVRAPLAVLPTDTAESRGTCGGPFTEVTYDLRNERSANIDWTVTVDRPELVQVHPTGGSLTSSGQVEVTASITEAANALPTGRYPVHVIFGQPATGFELTRALNLEITSLVVEPDTPLSFRGPMAGPFEPADASYLIHNSGVTELEWSARFTDTSIPPTGVNWLELSESQGTILNPHGVAEIILSPGPAATRLSPGIYTGTVMFGHDAIEGGCPSARTVRLEVGRGAFSIPMAFVPGADQQINGPTHGFRIGVFEVTNEQYARFLNEVYEGSDAATLRRIEEGAQPRMGSRGMTAFGYLDHGSPPSGIVRLSGDGTLVLDAALGGAIEFSEDRYVVLESKESYPVVGVSWYGAAAFCNWMTLAQGMDDPDQRAYHDGPNRADFYPAVADAAGLAAGPRGFRLPMDAGSAGPHRFNEWYKAAARGGVDAAGRPLFTALYGFGRSTLEAADAHYASGSVADGRPTPVGFFNGINRLADTLVPTRDTSNGYGLYDLCGNVAEWVHDAGPGGEAAVRGGHFNNAASSLFLRSASRGGLPADRGYPFVGFRVAQSLEPVTLRVTQTGWKASGLAGGPVEPASVSVVLHNPAPYAQDDFAIELDGDWLVPDGVTPTVVPPSDTVELRLAVRVTASAPGLSPPPPGGFVLVPASDAQQPVGPDYDFWMGRFEVTNDRFAAFLNNLLDDVRAEFPDRPGPRSSHVYLDVDSGNVYLHDQPTGQEGVAAPTASIHVKLYDASVGRIRYVGDHYAVPEGFAGHPVVGVTWYGAVKYCNWLSLTQGIPAELLAYREAPSPDFQSWGPSVAGDRRRWVTETLGYRLPMDGESEGPAEFNEWHKAAAWDPLAGSEGENRRFAFGRDVLTSADANYWVNGDSEMEGTTSVGFFDGSRNLFHVKQVCYPVVPNETRTVNTENFYGLYDLCGNVSEFLQDVGDFSDHRGTRGGSWRTEAESTLLTNMGRGSRPAGIGFADVGFRVVRGTGHLAEVRVEDRIAQATHRGHFLLDVREPLKVVPLTDTEVQFRYGSAADGLPDPAATYSITHDSASAVDWRVEGTQDWLDVGQAESMDQEGTLAPGGAVTLEARTNALAADLAPGRHTALIVIENVHTRAIQTRAFVVSVDPPVRVVAEQAEPQEFIGWPGGPFDRPLAQRTFELRSDVSFPLDFVASPTSSWLNLSAEDGLSGTLAALGVRRFSISVDEAADSLDVGKYAAALRIVYSDPANKGAGALLEQGITLDVGEWLVVSQPEEPWRIGPGLSADSLPLQTYHVETQGDAPIDLSISSDQPWLSVEPTFAKVVPGKRTPVTVTLTEAALALPNQGYSGTTYFENELTGTILCRRIELTVQEDLTVTPYDGFEPVGIVGSGVAPRLQPYQITNTSGGSEPLQWSAMLSPSDTGWVRLNGAGTAGGVLAEGASDSLLVEIDGPAAAQLPPGAHEAILEIIDLTHGVRIERRIRLQLIQPRFLQVESDVPVEPLQPGGPNYPYRVGTYHVTYGEYAAFLNDALAHRDDARGQYLYFDSSSGIVYVNFSPEGEVGAGSGGRSLRLFSPVLTGRMTYDGTEYRVASSPVDYARHPVAGVTWYGAVKYCNWLTLDQGLALSHRCYGEGPDSDPGTWRPVTISNAAWAVRDLTDGERELLVRGRRGYRLFMDDGAGNSVVGEDAADAYNEWYKAAAWNPTLEPRRNTLFGFGRSVLSGLDANYRDSGDEFDNGTTPVDAFEASNGNAFGIADMSGNLFQWTQDRFSTHAGNVAFRTIRGGSFNDVNVSPNLQTLSRTFTRADRIDGQIGFRVLRTLADPNGDFDADGDVDPADLARFIGGLTGPSGFVMPDWTVFDFNGDGSIDLADAARFQVTFTGGF